MISVARSRRHHSTTRSAALFWFTHHPCWLKTCNYLVFSCIFFPCFFRYSRQPGGSALQPSPALVEATCTLTWWAPHVGCTFVLGCTEVYMIQTVIFFPQQSKPQDCTEAETERLTRRSPWYVCTPVGVCLTLSGLQCFKWILTGSRLNWESVCGILSVREVSALTVLLKPQQAAVPWH